MDVKSVFPNRYLTMEISQDVNDINDIDDVIETYCHVEVSQDDGIDVNITEGVIVKDNGNLIIVQIYVDDIMFRGMPSKMVYHFQ